MPTIESNDIKVEIAAQGAELQRITDKRTGVEYMWNADPAYWAKHSPILFPIVGSLKDNTYLYEGIPYNLPRHGFAREMEFQLYQQSGHGLTFKLSSNEATLTRYPFPFELYIEYLVAGPVLSVSYRVVNIGEKSMYFSIGGHPAFKVPIFEGDTYTDYTLEFNQFENAGRWLLDNGLLENGTVPLLENTDQLPLRKELFEADAIVFKKLSSTKVRLIQERTGKGFEFDFNGFPYLGIWAAKGADFVCIEPWCGIADNVDSNQQLVEKEGINELGAGGLFERTWKFAVID
ncbi:aldose 1-epimerase family protein [Niabella hibiscisoli]|uniref:aldose 1-epimerase family protein n=1 Tax=Niabella hibiscisoli TaxID=1825928 RepID=UPI001F1031D0|nr:aldose 1-epimerase family protein [Niabella hibiscisoli]MCH5718036.1 aldose 1-epimerase family protein [Niabella hibiscisoli]